MEWNRRSGRRLAYFVRRQALRNLRLLPIYCSFLITMVARTGSIFAAVGSAVTLTSPDGVSWTVSAFSDQLEGVAWSPNLGLFAAVGLKGVAWSGSRLVVVGNNSTILTFE